jgi:hypothetical protein
MPFSMPKLAGLKTYGNCQKGCAGVCAAVAEWVGPEVFEPCYAGCQASCAAACLRYPIKICSTHDAGDVPASAVEAWVLHPEQGEREVLGG